MKPRSPVVSRVRSLGRALAASFLAAAVVTCDSPTSAGRPGVVAVAPSLSPVFSQLQFAGLVVDQARITITRPPSTVIATEIFAFAPESTTLNARVDVLVQGSGETFDALIELLAGGTTVFSGTQQVYVVPGLPPAGTQPVPIPVTYVGPGTNVGVLQVAPTSAGVTFGQTHQFTVTALDSQAQPVASFYAGWRTTDPAHTVDAMGLLRAGNSRGAFYVIAETPTGIRDTARVFVTPTASAIAIVSGNGQSGVLGTVLSQPLVVRVTAADALPVAGVTVTFAAATGGGSVATPSATTDSLGLASTTVTLGAAAGSNTFTAAVAGAGQVSFSATATTAAGVPSTIQKVAGDGQTATQGTAVAVPPRVRVVDAFGTRVAGVQVQFAVTAGGGSVTGGSVTTDTGGYAQVGSWTLGAALGANALSATLPAFAGVPAAVFAATSTTLLPAMTLSVPGNLVSMAGGTNLTITLGAAAPAGGVTVTVTSDSTSYVTVASGGTVSIAAGATVGTIGLNGVAPGVSILHATAPGYLPATLMVAVTPNVLTVSAATVQAGQNATVTITAIPSPASNLAVTVSSTDTTVARVTTPNVTILAGQSTATATVQGVAFGVAGILATATGYQQGGNTVTVNGVPTTLTLVSGGNQTASPSTTLPQPVVVLVTDVGSNPVAGYPVTFAVTSGGGSVGTPSTTTNASGLASTTWTLGAAAGTQTITATASGLAGSPLIVSANAPTIATTTVAPQLDTITAINGTRTLVAQAKDGTGANLTGSFTWVSRNPAVATVSVTGLVRAVTNGATYVVATEAGGTRDSALIVVNQRIGSINVTPGNRSIYLTRDFTFIATAVDGLGTPLPVQPTFTWTTTAPAVATVDAAGKVTAVGLGVAQIRATSGSVIGVANVSVITPITRIAVVVDTVGAAVTDTFTMTSLGLMRRYRAVAHDTLDVVMTGISFTWVSTNGSVALMNSTTGDTASVTSAANGVTVIRATAQGFTSNPGALLTVQQVLASIVLSPPASNPTATIGIGGVLNVVARGRDANNRFIQGGTFAYATSNASIATVNASTGQVAGVANGTANITATSGAITSNALAVTVGGVVPPIISFGRDTVSVGRGSTASIPILLSTPAAANLTVNLGATAFAHWQTSSVTITAGQTSVNATLVGDSAGTTTVTATDGSGLGYAAASAVAKVTANMRLTSTGYAINATDIVTTQVLLSDPSPAGGTYVTFIYGTPGIAQVSPDPAFIPQGQLAADIQIRGLAGGSTTITPNAIGVNGQSSSFTAYAPVLQRSRTSFRVGQGQYDDGTYVYTPTSTNVAVPVTLTSSDTTIIRVTPSVTIPSGSYYAYFTATAVGIGSATITMSAPGWTAAGTIAVTATTPRVGVSGGGTYFTTTPTMNVTVYAEDSVGTVHNRTNSLVVRLRSSDSTVLRVIDTLVTIPPNQYYSSNARVAPGGMVGTAYLVATASGHRADSVLYTMQGPPLTLSWTTARIGAGQEDISGRYVSTPNNVTAPLVVTIANSDPTVLNIPATVTIPAGTYYQYFDIRGLIPGSVQLVATAPGFAPDTATYVVTSPRLTACCNSTVNAFGSGGAITVYSADSLRSVHNRSAPLVVSMSSTDPSVVTLDSASVTIPAGQYYNNQARFTPVGVGTARIIFSATGHPALDTLTITVNTPKLNFSFTTQNLGRRQHFDPSNNGFYVYTPDYRTSPLAVTITQRNPAVDSLTATSFTIDSATYYRYLDAYGLSNGTDTLIASAPGYLPDTAFIRVTTPRLSASGLPGSTTTTNPPLGVTVYATDSVGSIHYPMDTVVVAVTSSNPAVLQPAQAYVRIPRNVYYVSTTVNVTGPGTASIIVTDSAGTGYVPDTTNVVTVTGPSLSLSWSTRQLGMRQTDGPSSGYVYTPNSVAADLVVNLASTDTRVVTVPASVTIPAGLNYAYFPITAMDTIGTIQVQATASGYGGAAASVQVSVPRLLVYTSTSIYTTSPREAITVQTADASGSVHTTTEAVTVTLVSSAPSVASIDSLTVTIPAGQYYHNTAGWTPGLIGTARFTASDQRSAYYKYSDGIVDVNVLTPYLGFSWGTRNLGIGQYDDYAYVQTPNYQSAPLAVTFTRSGTPRTATYANLTTTPITGVTVATSQYLEYFRLAGTAVGTDTLIASATSPAHTSDSAFTVVALGRVDYGNGTLNGWPGTLAVGDSALVTLYAYDQTGYSAHYVLANETFTLAPNANIEFRSGGTSSTLITQATIPASQYFVQFYVKALASGTGSVTITNANYSTYSTSVTVP